MALFGYPAAQENDAERAVRAALAIQRALAEINAKNAHNGMPELRARIGLEAGPVVIDVTGEIFGDAPNVAARVQAAAEPGSVLVTMNVHRQVAGLFIAEERGAHELKGVAEPIQLFRIARASGAGRRSGARTSTPFVGRDEELGVLARCWTNSRAGEGQFVLIVGEPGLGKSRLIEQFHRALAEAPHTWVEWSASQLLQNTPLHPIAEWGRARFGGADVAPETRLAGASGEGMAPSARSRRRTISRATSSDASSDQRSEVLNATTRTGSLYWPDIRSLMVVSRSTSPRSVSANAGPSFP
jgi:hypothetical protein